MLTFLITCKTEIMRLGITSIIRDLFPQAALLHADCRREYLRILTCEKVRMVISDGTVDNGPNPGMIRNVRALQPDTKIVMLLERTAADWLRAAHPNAKIDLCIGKNVPIEHIHEAILHALSGAEA